MVRFFNPVFVTENMVGHKLGEFSLTRTFKKRRRTYGQSGGQIVFMEAFAILKNVPMSAQKMREVTRQVQGLGALEAMAVLNIVPRKGRAARLQGAAFGDRQRGEQQEFEAGNVTCEGSGCRNCDHPQTFSTQGARFGRSDPQAPLPHQNHRFGRIIGMGQKTNPIGLRVAVNKDWRSKWYANKKDFGGLLSEDRKIVIF